jgi:hypothetical protein
MSISIQYQISRKTVQWEPNWYMGTDGHDEGYKTFAPLCEHAKSCINTVLPQGTAVGYLKLPLWSRLAVQRYHMLFWHLWPINCQCWNTGEKSGQSAWLFPFHWLFEAAGLNSTGMLLIRRLGVFLCLLLNPPVFSYIHDIKPFKIVLNLQGVPNRNLE